MLCDLNYNMGRFARMHIFFLIFYTGWKVFHFLNPGEVLIRLWHSVQIWPCKFYSFLNNFILLTLWNALMYFWKMCCLLLARYSYNWRLVYLLGNIGVCCSLLSWFYCKFILVLKQIRDEILLFMCYDARIKDICSDLICIFTTICLSWVL